MTNTKLTFRKNPGFDPRDAHYEAVHPRTPNVIYDVQRLVDIDSSVGPWIVRVLRVRHSGDDYSVDSRYISPMGYRTMRDARAACQAHAEIVVG